MSFHRKRVERFVAALNFTPEEGAEIKKRAETAIAEFSNSEDGNFSGGKLEEVLGNKERVEAFDELWEKHRAVLNS